MKFKAAKSNFCQHSVGPLVRYHRCSPNRCLPRRHAVKAALSRLVRCRILYLWVSLRCINNIWCGGKGEERQQDTYREDWQLPRRQLRSCLVVDKHVLNCSTTLTPLLPNKFGVHGWRCMLSLSLYLWFLARVMRVNIFCDPASDGCTTTKDYWASAKDGSTSIKIQEPRSHNITSYQSLALCVDRKCGAFFIWAASLVSTPQSAWWNAQRVPRLLWDFTPFFSSFGEWRGRTDQVAILPLTLIFSSSIFSQSSRSILRQTTWLLEKYHRAKVKT